MRKNALQKVQQAEKQSESTKEWYDIVHTRIRCNVMTTYR